MGALYNLNSDTVRVYIQCTHLILVYTYVGLLINCLRITWLLINMRFWRFLSSYSSLLCSSSTMKSASAFTYVVQASIKPVHKRKFHFKSSAAVITLDTSQKLTLPSFPKEKDYLADCPWNVPHYTAMVRGSWGLVSSSGYPKHFSLSWPPNTLHSIRDSLLRKNATRSRRFHQQLD